MKNFFNSVKIKLINLKGLTQIYKLKLKKYRIMHNLTQKELAVAIGVTQSYIAKLESEERIESPTLHVIEKSSELFNVCIGKLIENNPYCCNCNKAL